jgi:membrane protein insertase Oxa1/YidC/SpoIIIJ
VVLSVHSEGMVVSLPCWSQVMSHGFITAPLKRFANNDDLQSGVHKSVCTVLKTCLLHHSGRYQTHGIDLFTSVGSVWNVLKCDYMAVIIYQLSPNNFWTSIVGSYIILKVVFLIYIYIYIYKQLDSRETMYSLTIFCDHLL